MTRTRSWSSVVSAGVGSDFMKRFRKLRAVDRRQCSGILPGRVQLDTCREGRDSSTAAKTGRAGTTVKSGGFGLRWEERANAVTPGANIVNNAGVLLNRIA